MSSENIGPAFDGEMPVAVPRMYNKDEYWDLSGLPFNAAGTPRPRPDEQVPDPEDPALD